ncbi:MAG: nucleotidyl transferase AbiEii/AbiGii toxin family protein [Alphaproteobacteria bacterium]|nr:nucleotidyl transferase AbiEii/AbiGii toxin family protein [Alphaproteobacteria bacterium]
MRKPTNTGASVRARLLNLARQRKQPFQVLLTRFVLERLLYRLSTTPHRDRFVLKGAMLLTSWFPDPLRPTQDLDLLGFGSSDAHAMLAVFREVCAVTHDDGVDFYVAGLAVEFIREELEYGGLRLKTNATVDGARVRVVIDIGFGDAVEPTEIVLPVLLDLPAPTLRAYRPEAVIAEKFQAMVMLGRANSRMKDFYDIWVLSRSHEFADDRLARAIRATFDRRRTPIPTTSPDCLTAEFAGDPEKQQQWTSFAQDVASKPGSLVTVVTELDQFLMPYARVAQRLSE